jgi:hypothetical protein
MKVGGLKITKKVNENYKTIIISITKFHRVTLNIMTMSKMTMSIITLSITQGWQTKIYKKCYLKLQNCYKTLKVVITAIL